MSKYLILPLTALLLTGCSSTMMSIDVEIGTEDPRMRSLLSTAAEQVIERRVLNIEGEIPGIRIEARDQWEKIRMDVELQNKETKEILAEQLTSPLMLFLAREAEEGEDPNIFNEQAGSFMKLGLTEEHIVWIGVQEVEDGKARAGINLTDEGKELWKKIFEENIGKRISLFVRGSLISSIVIPDEEVLETIIIAGIPSLDLANVFADDINTAIYVTFTPHL